MKLFQFKGVGGLFSLMGSVLFFLITVFFLPSGFMMVLWNSVVYEGFNGPGIQLYQGLLLWMMVLIVLNLMFQPQISMHIQKMQPPDDQLPSGKK